MRKYFLKRSDFEGEPCQGTDLADRINAVVVLKAGDAVFGGAEEAGDPRM